MNTSTNYDIDIEQEGEGIKARIVRIKGTRNYRIYIKGVKKPFIYKLAEKNTEADLRRNYEFIIKKLIALIPKRRTRTTVKKQPQIVSIPIPSETIITQLRQRELEREIKDKTPQPKEATKETPKERVKEEIKEPPKESLIKRAITFVKGSEPKEITNIPKEVKYLGSNQVEVKFMDSGNVYRGDADEFVKKFTVNPELIKKLNKDIEDERKKVAKQQEELKNANKRAQDLADTAAKRLEDERSALKAKIDNQFISSNISNRNLIAEAIERLPEFEDIRTNTNYRVNPTLSKGRAIEVGKPGTTKKGKPNIVWDSITEPQLKALLTPDKLKAVHEYALKEKPDYVKSINENYIKADIPAIDIPNIRTAEDLTEEAKQLEKKRKADEEAGENTALTITLPEPKEEEAAGMNFLKDVEPGDVIITQRDSNFTPSEEFTKLMDAKVQEYAEKNKPSSWVQYMKGMMDKKGNKEGKGKIFTLKTLVSKGTTTTELTEYANKLNIPYFQGVLPFDYLKSLKPAPVISAIFNLDNSNQLGSHWCALIIGNGKIEYYDSLCMNKKVPELLEYIKHVLPRNPQETKLNYVRHQYESGSNCGWFCLKFLNDRLNKNQTWAQATDFEIFTKARKNEKDIEEFKHIIKDYELDTQIGSGEIHRELSDVAYTPADKRPEELSDYKYNRALSDDRTAVYYKEGEKPIIAYRGTDVKSKKDLVDDVRLIFGTLKDTKRVKSAINTAKKVESEYGVKPAVVGHSLAGAVAEIVGNKIGADTITYSKGTSPLPFTTPSQKKSKSRLVQHNINILDPISALGTIKNKAKNIIITTPKSLNPHSLENYK